MWSLLLAGEKKQLMTSCVMEVAHVCLQPPQASSGVTRTVVYRELHISNWEKIGEKKHTHTDTQNKLLCSESAVQC